MQAVKGTAIIQIGGKERPIFFGFYQSRIFCDLRKIEYYDYAGHINKAFGLKDYVAAENETEEERTAKIVSRMDFFAMADLIYSALVAGCEHPDHNLKQDFTHKEVMYWIDTLKPEEMAKVYATLLSANKSPNAETQATAEQSA